MNPRAAYLIAGVFIGAALMALDDDTRNDILLFALGGYIGYRLGTMYPLEVKEDAKK